MAAAGRDAAIVGPSQNDRLWRTNEVPRARAWTFGDLLTPAQILAADLHEPIPGLTLDKPEPRLTRGDGEGLPLASSGRLTRRDTPEKPPPRRLPSMRVVPIKTRRGGNLQ
jgi:hypothetical protein